MVDCHVGTVATRRNGAIALGHEVRTMTHELGFIGAGNMAEAIARAAIDSGIMEPSGMIAADPDPARGQVFAALGVAVAEDNAAVVRGARHVLLAVKPQTLEAVAQSVGETLDAEAQVIISIMAGITIDRIRSVLGKPARIVRVMPNTPLMVGCGMAAVAVGPDARPGDEAMALRLFGAAGEAVFVPEASLDAVTAVSGSGPAYLFYLAEAMTEAAVTLGLEEHADLLVCQTMLGAARLLKESERSAAELRRQVTSPGGTTEAAVTHLDGNATAQVVINAIKAAAERSRALND